MSVPMTLNDLETLDAKNHCFRAELNNAICGQPRITFA